VLFCRFPPATSTHRYALTSNPFQACALALSRQQPIEFGGRVALALTVGDDDLPAQTFAFATMTNELVRSISIFSFSRSAIIV